MSEKTYLLLMAAVLGGLGVAVWKMRAPAIANASTFAPPSALAKWPLSGATPQNGPRGVTHTSARDADGTHVDVTEFDFKANPKLRLELFDQDSDDAKPFDDSARYWGRNAAYILTHESTANRPIVAAFNGGPFGFDRSKNVDEAHHVAPLVENGKVHFEATTSQVSPLWIFGVRGESGILKFDTVLQPAQLKRERFHFATGGVQCLIRRGSALSVAPPPTDQKWGRLKAPTASEVGSLGREDWEKKSRVSLAWNQDCSKLWVLSVRESEAETTSRVALSLRVRGQADATTPPVSGGWSLSDVQNFWKSKNAWGAVLLASGDFAQLAQRRSDGQIDFVPSYVSTHFWKQARGRTRLVCSPTLKGAPTGGSALFYWVVREEK